jgi:hypothetical protein
MQIFLTLELFGGEWSASLFGRFTPGERPPPPVAIEYEATQTQKKQ